MLLDVGLLQAWDFEYELLFAHLFCHQVSLSNRSSTNFFQHLVFKSQVLSSFGHPKSITMKSNESTTDRVIRMFLGVSVAMYFVNYNSAWALLGLIPFVTGVVGFCPLYAALGISTLKPESQEG